MRRLSILLAAGLLALVSAAPAAAGAPGLSRHDRIVAHWTPARMAAAVPRDFNASGLRANGKPTTGGGGVVGASWTKGGLVLKATGKVYFEMGGGAWICSGSVIADTLTNSSLVLTAGHCAIDETTGEFATNWLFIPDFDAAPTYTCASTAYGCWTADALVVDRGFATAGGFNHQATVNDFAFAVVGAGGKSGTAQLDATVGTFPIAFSGVSAGDKLYAFGYPAAGKYHGADLTYCAGNIFTDAANSNDTWGMACDMTGGSSGGPWFAGFNEKTGSGTVSSLNSYGYGGVKNMYGPKFNSNTAAVYGAANAGATGDVIVPVP